MKTIYFILVFFLLLTFLYSTIINIPADQPTIQAGIDVSIDADTVLVQPGTYVENINYNGKLITVGSLFLTTQDTTYISQTIIDGDSLDSVVKFESGEDSTALLAGFTITNGYSYSGGGVFCYYSSPSLMNITIVDNSANLDYYGNGGGIWCRHYSSPSLVNVTIVDNSAVRGGGINCFINSSPILQNVTIIGNTAGSGGGGGIWCRYNSSPSLVNVTITYNNASYAGGGIYSDESSPSLVNCILWNDLPQEIHYYSGYVTATYSDIEGGWAGTGVINEDPLFVGTGDHPFMLQDLSPCVNAGIPNTTGLNLPEFDLAGNPRVYGGRIDMGAYENQNVVGANEDLIPLITKLNQNYPNPFNPTTTINYSLKENSKVSLNIYNIKGQKVKQLVRDQLLAGLHSAIWDGRDSNDKRVSSGIYFYKLKTVNFEMIRKMILIK